LDLVALFEETLQVAHLDLIVALVGAWPELDFLDLDDLLLGTSLVLPLLFLVLEFAVVHQATDRRPGLWRDLDEIEIGLFGHSQRFTYMNDAYRLVVGPDEPDLQCVDLTVDAVRAFRRCSDAAFSFWSGKEEPCGSLGVRHLAGNVR